MTAANERRAHLQTTRREAARTGIHPTELVAKAITKVERKTRITFAAVTAAVVAWAVGIAPGKLTIVVAVLGVGYFVALGAARNVLLATAVDVANDPDPGPGR